MERHEVLAMMTALKLAGMRTADDDILADGLKRRHPVQQIIGTLLPMSDTTVTGRPRPGSHQVTMSVEVGTSTGCPRVADMSGE